MKFSFKDFCLPALALSAAGFSSAALAAAPTNDTFAGATPVAVGFSEVLDTTDATTDANDAQLNFDCGAPATDASVWYVIDGADIGVVVDVSNSDYSAGVLVGVGSQGNLEIVTCGSGSVAFAAEAGTTYYVLAFDDQDDGGGNGGSLNISFTETAPPPTVDIALNRYGRVDSHTGIATVSGTYTCTNGDYLDVFIEANQRVGRGSVLGNGGFETDTCDGQPHAWSIDVFPQNGKFAGGKTLTMNFIFSCGEILCTDGYFEQTIQLRGGAQSKGHPKPKASAGGRSK